MTQKIIFHTWSEILQQEKRRLTKQTKSAKTILMGILNLTPDSFFNDGEQHLNAIIQKFEQLIKDGATIIDIGAESSNPSSQKIELEQEWERLLPFLLWLQHHKPEEIIISLDTYKPEIMRRSLNLGVIDILNDIQGFRSDDALKVLQDYPQCLAIIMHMNGENPQTMQSQQQLLVYEKENKTATQHVINFFQKQTQRFLEQKIAINRICYDVGIGFGKTFEDNIALLKNHHNIRNQFLDAPFLLGISRKRFLGPLIEEKENNPQNRLFASLSAQLFGIEQGDANIIRTHDVAAMSDVLKVWNALRN